MDGIIPAWGEEYVESDYRHDQQHTYRCHYQIEVRQMFGRAALDHIIAFHIGHTEQQEKE